MIFSAWGFSWGFSWGNAWGNVPAVPPTLVLTMPNVIGLLYADALAVFVASGVRVLPFAYFMNDPITATWIPSPANVNVVLSQKPTAGTIVVTNASIALTVSSSPMGTACPAGDTNV